MGLKNFLSSFNSKAKKETDLNGLLDEWINKLENYSSPGKDIKALNFGLFESDKGFMIYLTGAKLYADANDDWATEIDYEPIALYKYLLLNSDEVKGLKWDGVLDKVKAALENIISTNPKYNLFKNRIVTTGFDDGDLKKIKAS